MKRQSAKTAGIYRKWMPIRNAFLALFPWCAFCGRTHGLAVHEILSGPMRMLAFVTRACWLPLCGPCNCDEATDRTKWPVEKQLAVKLDLDPAGFDQDEVDRIYSPRRIDWAEVLRHYVEIKRRGTADAA